MNASDGFAYDAGLANGSNANDNNYSTYAYHSANNTYYYAYWNYSSSLPPGLTSALWQVKHGTLAAYNSTLSVACLAQYPMQLRMWSYFLNSSYTTNSTANGTILVRVTSGDIVVADPSRGAVRSVCQTAAAASIRGEV